MGARHQVAYLQCLLPVTAQPFYHLRHGSHRPGGHGVEFSAISVTDLVADWLDWLGNHLSAPLPLSIADLLVHERHHGGHLDVDPPPGARSEPTKAHTLCASTAVNMVPLRPSCPIRATHARLYGLTLGRGPEERSAAHTRRHQRAWRAANAEDPCGGTNAEEVSREAKQEDWERGER